MPAVHMHFRADEIAGLERFDFAADGFDDAAEFMPERYRRLDARLRPAVPSVNVQVRAADGRGFHAHQDVARPGGRYGGRFERESARRGGFSQGLHELWHVEFSLITQPAMLTHGFGAPPNRRTRKPSRPRGAAALNVLDVAKIGGFAQRGKRIARRDELVRDVTFIAASHNAAHYAVPLHFLRAIEL